MNKSRSIIKKITCPNSDGTDDPVIGISGCLVIGHHTNSTISTSSNFQSSQNGKLEFRDTQNNKMFITTPDSNDFLSEHTPLIHVMPNKPIRTVIQELYAYIDNYVKGLDIKQSVDVATTKNIIDIKNADVTSMTIDTISYLAQPFNRVLVKDQTDKKENGIYEVSGNKLVRAGDFTNSTDTVEGVTVPEDFEGFVTPGCFTFVEQGDINRYRGYAVTKISHSEDDRLRINTDEINFTQFTGIQPLKEGHGLTVDRINNIIKVNMDISFNDVSLNRIGYGHLNTSNKNIDVNADLIPLEKTNGTNYNLGSPSSRWDTIHVTNVKSTDISSNKIDTVTINANDVSANDISANDISANDISANAISLNVINYGNSYNTTKSIDVNAHLIPTLNKNYNLGTNDSSWNKIYVKDVISTDISSNKIESESLFVNDVSSSFIKVTDISAIELKITSIETENLIADDICGNFLNITDISAVNLKLDKITAYNANQVDASSIDISANLIPTLNEHFDLGSASKRWKDLYLSGNTIDMDNTKLKVVKNLQTNGNELVSFVFQPNNDQDTNLQIAAAEYKSTTNSNGLVNTELISFKVGELEKLGDVNISPSDLSGGEPLIYNEEDGKWEAGVTNYVNKSKQTFYEIQTNQPVKFKMMDASRNIDSGSVKINYSFENIIAMDDYPNGSRSLSNNYTNKKESVIPYIDKFQVDISGSTDSDFTGSQGSDYRSGWINYQTIQIDNSKDYYTDSYTFHNSQGGFGVTLPFNEFKIFKTSDSNSEKNTDVIFNILKQTNEDPNSNPNYYFDLRVYGINDAPNNISILERALVFKNLYFNSANPPKKPVQVTGQQSLYNNSTRKVILQDSYETEETEEGKSTSSARVVYVDVSYNITETLVSTFPSNQENNLINRNQEFDLNSSPLSNNRPYLFSITNMYNSSSYQEVRNGTKFSYQVRMKNNLRNAYSTYSTQQVTPFTQIYSSGLSNKIDNISLKNFNNLSILSSTSSQQILTGPTLDKIYINVSSGNSDSNKNNIQFGVNNTNNNYGHFEVTNPSSTSSDSSPQLGKNIVSDTDYYVSFTYKVNSDIKALAKYYGFKSLSWTTLQTYARNTGGNFTNGYKFKGVISETPDSDTIRPTAYLGVTGASDNQTQVYDAFSGSPFARKGLRLKGGINLATISNTNVTSYIHGPSVNPIDLELELIREATVTSLTSPCKFNFQLYIDLLSGLPAISSGSDTLDTILLIDSDSLIYTMGVPSVKYFKINIKRKYENLNSQYKYLSNNGKIVEFKEVTKTRVNSNTHGSITVQHSDISQDGSYTFTEDEIKTNTNNYYQKISFSEYIDNSTTNIKIYEKLYSLNVISGHSVNRDIPISLYYDADSYSQSSFTNGYAGTFNRNISNTNWEKIYEIKNDQYSKLTNSNIRDLKNPSNLIQITDHQKIVEDATLLYIRGFFQTNASSPYPEIKDTVYTGHDGFRSNNPNSSSVTTYNSSQITASLSYNQKTYKWIVFKFTEQDDIGKIGNLDTINLYEKLFQINYFKPSVESALKSSSNTDAIGIIMSSASNQPGIGNLSLGLFPNTPWYNQNPANVQNFNGLSNVLDTTSQLYGSITQSGNNWGPVINKTTSGDANFYVFIGLNNDHDFS
jgi:hypothetical protein